MSLTSINQCANSKCNPHEKNDCPGSRGHRGLFFSLSVVPRYDSHVVMDMQITSDSFKFFNVTTVKQISFIM